MSARQGSPHSIWYASYGSNLNRDRFMCYIEGGRPHGSTHQNSGARDRTPPTDNGTVTLPYDLYFAGYSNGWNGAPAFIRKSNDKRTYFRMYRISDDQFNDVVLQENGKPVDGVRFVPAFEELLAIPEFILPGNPLYGKLLHVGDDGGSPILTFSTALDLPIAPPSAAYIKVIASGLKETYPHMSNSDICEYLSQCDGIRDGGISGFELVTCVTEARPRSDR